MTIATLESPNFSVPHVQTAIEVAVDDVNQHGGVNGRPLEPHFCNDKFDPNEAAACARQAADLGAVAVVGGVTPQAPAIFPVLTEAKVPWVAGSGTSGAVELQDPISYPIQGGSPAMLIGVGKTLVTEGGTKFAIISTDNAASKAGAAAVLQGIQLAGKDAETFTAPLDTLDYTAIVATALATNPDAVAITSPPDAAPKVVQALNQAGYTGLIATANTNLAQAAIDSLGDVANGVYLGFRMVPTSNMDNPTVNAFVTAIQAKQPDVRIDELGLNAWTGIHFIQQVLEQSGATDGAGVIDFLDNIKTPIELGSVPPYGSLKAPEEFPRAVNFVTIIGQVADGKIVQQGDFVDPLG
jgi:branched-chain amino acid transport system substrate-binding protein